MPNVSMSRDAIPQTDDPHMHQFAQNDYESLLHPTQITGPSEDEIAALKTLNYLRHNPGVQNLWDAWTGVDPAMKVGAFFLASFGPSAPDCVNWNSVQKARQLENIYSACELETLLDNAVESGLID